MSYAKINLKGFVLLKLKRVLEERHGKYQNAQEILDEVLFSNKKEDFGFFKDLKFVKNYKPENKLKKEIKVLKEEIERTKDIGLLFDLKKDLNKLSFYKSTLNHRKKIIHFNRKIIVKSESLDVENIVLFNLKDDINGNYKKIIEDYLLYLRREDLDSIEENLKVFQKKSKKEGLFLSLELLKELRKRKEKLLLSLIKS